MSYVYQLCFTRQNAPMAVFVRNVVLLSLLYSCRSHHHGLMIALVLFGVISAGLMLAALFGVTPDTHREVIQHGNFEF